MFNTTDEIRRLTKQQQLIGDLKRTELEQDVLMETQTIERTEENFNSYLLSKDTQSSVLKSKQQSFININGQNQQPEANSELKSKDSSSSPWPIVNLQRQQTGHFQDKEINNKPIPVVYQTSSFEPSKVNIEAPKADVNDSKGSQRTE